MRARSAAALAIALTATWVIAGPAQALEPGVFVDPGSPAGKEYSVPLSLLRGSGSGHPDNGSPSQPLFGIGISPTGVTATSRRAAGRQKASGQPNSAHPAGKSGPAHVSHAADHAGGARAAGGVGAPPSAAALQSLTNHGSATSEVALIATLVVIGGLGLGALVVAVRRRLG